MTILFKIYNVKKFEKNFAGTLHEQYPTVTFKEEQT